MTDRQRLVIMQRIAQLSAAAADLTRAVAYDDGTYIRANLTAIENHRGEVLTMIYDWQPELLQAHHPTPQAKEQTT